jgi:membrane-bound lytic murein transglycosylase F
VLGTVAAAVLLGCEAPQGTMSLFRSPLGSHAELGKLVIATRSDPTTYSTGESGSASGFEHDLLQLFAEHLGVQARFVVADNIGELNQQLAEGKVHLAADWLDRHADAPVHFSRPIYELRQLLVRHADSSPVGEVTQLDGRVVAAIAGSPSARALRALQGRSPVWC